MDSNSSDQSPQSENTGSSWLQCWENEISSLSGLNLGSDSELNSLVEDKEIAARAVAFVVNSTRKGIVPLCADVANLLRSKRSLEKKVFMLKRENEVLRSSASLSLRTSHSTSPTPASLSSEKGSVTEQAYQPHDKGRPCSRCSQTSSTISNSPQFEKSNRQRLSSLQNSPASSIESKGRRNSSPRFRRSRSCNRTQEGITTKAIIHHPPREITVVPPDDKILRVPEPEVHKKIERKNSLPEIVCEPDNSVQKISPRKSSVIDVQCSVSDHTIDDQFMETVRLNSRLAEDLGAAKKEIQMLKCRLRQLEAKQGHCPEDFYIENECERAGLQYLEDRVLWLNNNNSHNSKQSRCPGNHSQRSHAIKKVHPISPLYSEPLHGCKCSACQETFGSDADLTHNTSDGLSEGVRKFSVSHKLQVQMNDHVVCKGDRMGVIRYIGHLDRHGQINLLYVGLELDSPVGNHDGCLNGKRYFYCSKDHGIFVPIQEIICKVGKKTTKKSHSCENTEKGSRKKTTSLEISKFENTDRDHVFS